MLPFRSVLFPVDSSPAGEAVVPYVTDLVRHYRAALTLVHAYGPPPIRRLLMGSVTGAALEGRVAAPHYQAILCALDDSDEAEAVLRAASNLAHSYGAQLFLIHVVPMIPAASNLGFAVYQKGQLEAAAYKLHELKARRGVDAPQLFTDSVLVDAIANEALRRKADLLVVGRGESQRMGGTFWSVLYPLIREAPCPVLRI
jgi:nucleotide-binding universal stress UspA family protein